MKKFKFLEEKPLQSEKDFSDSSFGHEEIAEALTKIIANCPSPFTVGLIGKWGSGKSTIAHQLKDKLLNQDPKIPVVIFDVWKHEGDALRRTFLEELVRQLKNQKNGKSFLEKGFDLNKRTKRSESTSVEVGIEFNKEFWGQFLKIFLIACGFLFIFWVLATFFYLIPLLKIGITIIVSSSISGTFLVWLFQQSARFFSTKTVTYSIDRFEDPHEFEEEFGNVLAALNVRRILIVFDNLDRVAHDRVVEVLSTIKTFLEPQDIAEKDADVVFLVPCDAVAIKQQISKAYQGETGVGSFDPDEFLRKFFNTLIWIPSFLSSELEELSRKKLHETEVEILYKNDYVPWLITKAFRDNPRQIIQFTNILLANYLLVVEREGDELGKDFPKGFLEENIAQFTKFLLLSQLYPEEMEVCRLEKVADLQQVDEATQKIMLQIAGKNEKRVQRFLSFIHETRSAPITNLGQFFALRRSEQEKQFPGFDSFVSNLEDRKEDDSQKLLESFGNFSDPASVDAFSSAIRSVLAAKKNPVSLVNTVHSLLSLIHKTSKECLAETTYDEISTYLQKPENIKYVHTIPPNLQHAQLFSRRKDSANPLISQWITVLESMGGSGDVYKADKSFAHGVIEVCANHPHYLNIEQQQKLRSIMSEKFLNDLDVVRMALSSDASQQALLSKDFVQKFLDTIPAGGDVAAVVERLEVLGRLQQTFLASIGVDPVIDKLEAIITGENQLTENTQESKRSFLSAISKFIDTHSSWVESAATDSRDKLVNALIAGFSAQPNHDARAIFMPILLDAKHFATDPKKVAITEHVKSFVVNAAPDIFGGIHDELPEKIRKTYLEDPAIYTAAENRSLENEPFRNVWYVKLSDEMKKKFLSKLFSHNLDSALTFINSIVVKEKKNIFASLDDAWLKFDSADVALRTRLFEFVNDQIAGGEPSVRDVLATKIIDCLTNIDAGIQKVGLDGLTGAVDHIAKPRIRKIGKEVSDWLKKTETTPKHQPSAIRAVSKVFSEHSGEFNKEEHGEFTHFLFEELIRKANQIEVIDLGFELLSKTHPLYEERKTNFDDIRTRIESDVDKSIEDGLIRGLLILKPSKPSKESLDFWKWVDLRSVADESV